jgi:two-component system LytT family sensor kinase
MRSANLPLIEHSKHQWLFKYKLYHLPFWFGYHFMWWTLRIGSPMTVLTSLALPHAAAKFFFYMIFQMVGVYFNLYFLIPRFLEKGRYVSYIILLLLTIITTAAFIVTGYYFGAFISDKTFQELYGVDPGNYFSLFEGGALPSTVAAMTLAMSIKLTKNWIQARRREKLLETEKLETELKFLKSQFNPHFLFNTINSIFVLIDKNPRMASESLAKFSGLLRYQLYECNEQYIPLLQELSYLHNFIELEKLRQDGNTTWAFELEEPSNGNLCIAPFILMPFIENAFKHLSRHKEKPNWIHMHLHVKDQELHFMIANSTASRKNLSNGVKPYAGIGLKNVQRRLALIYAQQHTLSIDAQKDQYQVTLRLNLTLQQAAMQPAIQMT